MALVADDLIDKSLSKIRDDYVLQKVSDASKRESVRRLLASIENEFLVKAHVKKYRFDSFLGTYERKCVHDFCELVKGVFSRSFGEGDRRRICLYKCENEMLADVQKVAENDSNDALERSQGDKKFMEMEGWVHHMRELLQIARDAEIEEAKLGLEERVAEAAKLEREVKATSGHAATVEVTRARQRMAKKSFGPLIIDGSETALFGRCMITLKKYAGAILGHHKITVGDIVAISPYKSENICADNLPRGIVTRTKQNEIKVAFDDDVPYEYYSQSLFLNKLGNEVTWKRLNEALDKLLHYQADHAHRVASVAFGMQASISSHSLKKGNKVFTPFNQFLNASQIKAVNSALLTKDLCVIHGPPGTGKTTTVVELIHQAVQNGLSVLTCAPSNIAVDNIVERLARPVRDPKTGKLLAKAKIVRVGHPARVTKEVLQHCLEAHVERAEGTDIIADIKKDISGHIESLRHNKRKSSATKELLSTHKGDSKDVDGSDRRAGNGHSKLSRNDRNAIRFEIRTLRKEIRKREETVVRDIINQADVVLGTTVGVAGRVLSKRKIPFDLIIIDEAAQALEAECWLAMLKGRRCVLAGDHCQLPPTIMSEEAARRGLAVTLMDRIVQSNTKTKHKDSAHTRPTKPILNVPVIMLNVQYRMHDCICRWASKAMYHGGLKSDAAVAQHLLSDLSCVDKLKYESLFSTDSDNLHDIGSKNGTAMVLVDTAGCDGFQEMEDVERGSKANPGEAKVVLAYINRLVSCGIHEKDVAVITPYNGQVNLLRNAMLKSFPSIEVRSVDGFQGREKECIILSLVRSNINKQVGFLADQRRINVAVTRAKRHVGIICDSDTVNADKFLRGMLKHVESLEANGSIFSAEEFTDEIVQSQYAEFIDNSASENLVDSKANAMNRDKEANAKQILPSSSREGKTKVPRQQRATAIRRNHGIKVDTEAERLKKLEDLTKQLTEINKQSERSTDTDISKADEEAVEASKESEKDLDTSNDARSKQNQLEEVREAMAKTYQKHLQEKKKPGAKKKKKKKNKSKQKSDKDTHAPSSTSSITKGVPDTQLTEDQLLEQLIRENELVRPRTRPSFLNKNEPLPSYTSKKLESRLEMKRSTRQGERAKKIKEELAKKKKAKRKGGKRR